MPNRISTKNSKKKRIDSNQLAYLIIQQSTSENVPVGQDTLTKEQVSALMSAMGRKGGKIGGKRRLETMTPTKRRRQARKAAQARWKKNNKSKP
jgi:hypothetical protein